MRIKPQKTSTLLAALQEVFKESSNSRLKKWIHQERFLVNGEPVKNPQVVVFSTDTVTFLQKTPKIAPSPFPILYEDPYLIAIDKPKGILSVATEKEKERTVFRLLKEHRKDSSFHVVHRLDKETSGVMLFAKTLEALEDLKNLFYNHDLKRVYHAIVFGNPDPMEGTINSYLYQDKNYVVRETKNPNKGKTAITRYKTLKKTNVSALLECTLETGRTNQIRVHLKNLGHPILGDKKYGKEDDKTKELYLHASSLDFIHPITKEPLSLNSPPPSWLAKF